MSAQKFWRSFRPGGPAHFVARSYYDDDRNPIPMSGSTEGVGICGRVGLLFEPSENYCGRCRYVLTIESKRGEEPREQQ